MSQKIKITRIEKSKIQDVDFNNFSFGSVFTDHMFECDFIDGKWVNPTIKPYQPISIDHQQVYCIMVRQSLRE